MPNPNHKGGRPTPTEHPCWYVVVGFRPDRSTVSLVPPFFSKRGAIQEAYGRNLRHVGYPAVLAWGIKKVVQR